jgi:2-keto-4-pentenoate hydratase/2-oxohepta-3-ene-1,7-dioic acid hydratase in catechol pathway
MELSPVPARPLVGALCRIRLGERVRVGVLTEAGVVPTDLASPLDALVDGALDPAVLAAADAGAAHGTALDPDEVAFLPPVEPRTMLFAGRNYEDHLAEAPRPRQATPVLFAKLVSSLTGHGSPILVLPDQHVDYEGELALVIGRTARRIRIADALDVVAGYTIVNDVSDRAVQHVNNQMTMGKGPDTFCPMGPWLVPRAALGDGSGRRLRTWVNDELRQDATTSGMIHDVAACIEAATRTVTLQPGDVIATGTPGGVAAYRVPPAWLRPGDTVTVAIDGLGMLANPVVADPEG